MKNSNAGIFNNQEQTKAMTWSEVSNKGGLFFISHSGGKDSQAMYAHLIVDLKIPREQVVVVHAHLGAIEWSGVREHIEANINEHLHVVQAVDKNGDDKDFISMVKTRGMWPAPAYRQCTSDLKRGPIYKFIRATMKARGVSLAVNCTGMRAEESASRAKRPDWAINSQLSKAGREVYEWLPIQDWSTKRVFDRIREAGQYPFPAYGENGELNERLSCVFCIMGSVNDHRNGAANRPELYEQLVNMEKEMGHTMFHTKSLEERNGLTVAQAYNLIPTVAT